MKEQMKIRLQADLKGWLKKKAEQNDRSMNYVLVRLLEAAKRREEEGLV